MVGFGAENNAQILASEASHFQCGFYAKPYGKPMRKSAVIHTLYSINGGVV